MNRPFPVGVGELSLATFGENVLAAALLACSWRCWHAGASKPAAATSSTRPPRGLGPDGSRWGTLFVNVAGSAAAGVLAGLVARHGVDDTARVVVSPGFLGAFITFSSFAVDTVRLAGEGSSGSAALNVAVTLLTVGLAGAGYALAVAL